MTEVEEVEGVEEVTGVEDPATTEGHAEGDAAPDAADGGAVDGSLTNGDTADDGAVDAAAVEAGIDEDVGPPPPAFRVMDVEDVSLELPSQYPQITLVENEAPLRSLVFPVGLTEGTALALALRRMASPRPMTHELFMEVMQRVRVDVIALRLIGRENGNYLAELDIMAPQGRERIPCRPSDGLVLALRMPVSAPILVDERLLEDSGDVVPYLDE
jgi:bifunctional DNase/RNase